MSKDYHCTWHDKERTRATLTRITTTGRWWWKKTIEENAEVELVGHDNDYRDVGIWYFVGVAVDGQRVAIEGHRVSHINLDPTPCGGTKLQELMWWWKTGPERTKKIALAKSRAERTKAAASSSWKKRTELPKARVAP